MTPKDRWRANAEHIIARKRWRDDSVVGPDGKLIIDVDRYMLVEHSPNPDWTLALSFHRRVRDVEAFMDEDRAIQYAGGDWWPIALVDLSNGSCYPVRVQHRVQHQVSAWPSERLETAPSTEG